MFRLFNSLRSPCSVRSVNRLQKKSLARGVQWGRSIHNDSKHKVSKPTLTYFNLVARGEVSRLILEVAGVDYEYDTVTGKDWQAKKAELGDALLFRQVPLYREPSGLSLVQSGAIERYLSKKHGFAGSDDQQIAEIDAIAEGVTDFDNKIREAIRFPTESERPAKIQKLVAEDVPKWLSYFSNILAKGKKIYFGGEKATYADFRLFLSLDKIAGLEGGKDALEKFPDLVAFKERVANRPRIKSYYARDPYKK